MKYIDDWTAVKQRFSAWWQGNLSESPLLYIEARLPEPDAKLVPVQEFSEPDAKYLDVENIVNRRLNHYQKHKLLGDAFPQLSLDLGPGSLALYLGSEPGFTWDTVWFNECVDSVDNWPGFSFNPQNHWLKKHLEMFVQARNIIDQDLLLNMPDLVENMDILAALRGPQNLIYDMMDEPELIKQKVAELDAIYFNYFDLFLDLIAQENSNSYTAFNIWGPGRTAKVQCDFCALISPNQFREFVQPSLRRQCRQLDFSLYHLDGPDAIKHVPALMEITELSALQWTCGEGQPDGASEQWFPIYDQVRDAGKSLWIMLYDGNAGDWLYSAQKLISRYGKSCLYLNFPQMELAEAEMILQALH